MAEHLQPLLHENGKRETGNGGKCGLPAPPLVGPKHLDIEKQPLASILTFWFMNPVLRLGSKKMIALDDCPVLGPFDQGHVHYDNFKAKWDACKERRGGKLPSLTIALWQAFW